MEIFKTIFLNYAIKVINTTTLKTITKVTKIDINFLNFPLTLTTQVLTRQKLIFYNIKYKKNFCFLQVNGQINWTMIMQSNRE